ncbi:hypothetical protein MHYP_G00032580 [Metynnis hypsauchen]
MAAPLLEKVSDYLGSPEPAVRLILSILIGYPFALVYRRFLFHQSASVIHLFHTLSGLSLAIFNFGSQVYHSALCIIVQFLFLRLMGKDGDGRTEQLYLSDGEKDVYTTRTTCLKDLMCFSVAM